MWHVPPKWSIPAEVGMQASIQKYISYTKTVSIKSEPRRMLSFNLYTLYLSFFNSFVPIDVSYAQLNHLEQLVLRYALFPCDFWNAETFPYVYHLVTSFEFLCPLRFNQEDNSARKYFKNFIFFQVTISNSFRCKKCSQVSVLIEDLNGFCSSLDKNALCKQQATFIYAMAPLGCTGVKFMPRM